MSAKNTLLAIVLGVMANMGLSAQGYPVIDMTNLITAIETGYTTVQQLHTMYDNLKTSCDQLQQQIKNFESFDFNSLNVKDPMGSWKSITTYADRMKTYEQNIESIINKKDIKIGNGFYSLGDIFITPLTETMQNMGMDKLGFAIMDPFEKMLTQEEKLIFQKKFGISFGYHMRLDHMKELLQKKSAEIIGYSNTLRNNLEEDRLRLENISKDLFRSGSIVQQQQINNAVLSIMAQDVKTQANLLGNIAEQLAVNSSQTLLQKQAMLDEKNINSLNIAEGFMKMLNEMQSSSAYR
jgi:hypothetical protein